MNIGDKVEIKATQQKGKIVGQVKGQWLVEMCNGRTTLLPTNKMKVI